jgi:glycosyltransferase involved in cell wall biosynthesis
MKFTIITVCFNSEKTIGHTIKSVLSQSHKNIEYIVVDGGSKDKTISIVKGYGNKISKFISEPDNGIYDAINKGIKKSSGDFIGILNSDDFFASNTVLEVIAQILKKNHALDLVFSYLDIVQKDDDSKIIRKYRVNKYNKFMMRIGIMPPHPTFFIKRSIYNSLGENLYRTDMKISADFELILRLLLNVNPNYECIPFVSVIMRSGGISNKSFFSKIKLNKEILNACKINNFYSNFFFLIIKFFPRVLELIPFSFWRKN